MLLLTVRLPVIVHVTSSGFVSSMPSTFPVMVGWSGLTEIVCILFTQCMVYTFGRTLNYNYKIIRRFTFMIKSNGSNRFAANSSLTRHIQCDVDVGNFNV